MMPILKKQGIIAFSIIGALIIVVSAWLTKATDNNDTWLYVFSIWLIFFSAFEVYSSVKVHKASKIALAALVGASVIIVVAWWANGAENAWIFLTSAVTMLIVFLILAPRNK